MKNAYGLDEEGYFEKASSSRRPERRSAQQAMMHADLDENFQWHRIRRMSRK
ncbi:hypothetical protein [Herbaspirillum sp. alder98]|uniref:hypothetical protein n=1 Tax=Herbaspirillum sp. alder98 TaxID=2913096 RepID=UPI001CD8FBBA|nr:hypothetical protein [Herbaspirillum sp. alder98]MCA1325676.1 hypothetical protein [Herbaspirillum sp. alder98]